MRVYDNGVYRDMTEAEVAEFNRSAEVSVDAQINELKERLSQTDYQSIKYAEGLISEEDYATVKAERQGWRNEINRLQMTDEEV